MKSDLLRNKVLSSFLAERTGTCCFRCDFPVLLDSSGAYRTQENTPLVIRSIVSLLFQAHQPLPPNIRFCWVFQTGKVGHFEGTLLIIKTPPLNTFPVIAEAPGVFPQSGVFSLRQEGRKEEKKSVWWNQPKTIKLFTNS